MNGKLKNIFYDKKLKQFSLFVCCKINLRGGFISVIKNICKEKLSEIEVFFTEV